jgi:hypothetical protein
MIPGLSSTVLSKKLESCSVWGSHRCLKALSRKWATAWSIGTERHFLSASARGTTIISLALITGFDASSHHNYFLPKLDLADCHR